MKEKTLRDEMAMAALAALVSDRNLGDDILGDDTIQWIAAKAYQIADAMMEERERR